MPSALRLSLAANLVLVAIVAVLLWREPREAAPAPVSGDHRHTPAASAPAPEPAAAAPPVASGPARPTPAAIARLEQMGISRDVLVNALLGEFHRHWDERFASLERRYGPQPVPEREYVELGRLRDAEQVRMLREALGEERYLARDQERTLRMLNPGGIALNPDEAERAYRLQKQFDERYRELQMALEDGFADGVDVGTLHAQARAELDRELEKLLGRERLERMRGVTDPLADVYHTFGALQPTPDQAEAVLAVDDDWRAREAALAAQVRAEGRDVASLAAELQALHETREAGLRRIFGADNYDAMQRRNDPTFQRLHQFAEAWDLTAPEILSVHAELRAYRENTDRMRSAAAMSESAGQRVDWQAINAAIEQARQQTEAGLQSLIGADRAWRLQQDGLLATR